MGQCCPEDLPRKLGILSLVCLAVLLGFMAFSWTTSHFETKQREAARERRLNASEHEMAPIHRGDLDRG